MQKLYSFASNVQSGYRALPYHNALHACDVTHTMFWQLDQRFEPRRTASADGNERGSPDGASALTREPSRRGNPNAEERTTAVAPRATPPLSETVLGRALPNHAVLAALLGTDIKVHNALLCIIPHTSVVLKFFLPDQNTGSSCLIFYLPACLL